MSYASMATLALCVAGSLTISSLGTADEQLYALLERKYSRLELFALTGESQGAARVLAPGFIIENVDGTTENADQFLSEGLPIRGQNRKGGESEMRLLSIERRGNTAIVAVQHQMKATRAEPVTGAPQEVRQTTKSTDRWMFFNGDWLLTRSVTIEASYCVEGKEVRHELHR